MKFLVAKNIEVAIDVGKEQEGWVRTGSRTFRDKDGEEIQVIWQPADLRGHPPGLVVYIGHGYSERNWDEIRRFDVMFHDRKSDVIYLEGA